MTGPQVFPWRLERMAGGKEIVDEVGGFVVIAKRHTRIIGANFFGRNDLALALTLDPLAVCRRPALAIAAMLHVDVTPTLGLRCVDRPIREDLAVLRAFEFLQILIGLLQRVQNPRLAQVIYRRADPKSRKRVARQRISNAPVVLRPVSTLLMIQARNLRRAAVRKRSAVDQKTHRLLHRLVPSGATGHKIGISQLGPAARPVTQRQLRAQLLTRTLEP